MAAVDMPPYSRVLRIIEHPAVKILVPIAIGLLAVFVLHKLAARITWADVKTDLAAVPALMLLKAVGCMALSYVGIALYDALAVRSVVPGKVPLAIAALTSAAGYAISGLLGVSYLTGTAVRYRVYAAFGLDLGQVAGGIAISWTEFLSGLALVPGGLLAFHPQGLNMVLPISVAVETTLGLGILAALAGYLFWLARGRRHFRLGGFALPLPGAKTGAALTGAGCALSNKSLAQNGGPIIWPAPAGWPRRKSCMR